MSDLEGVEGSSGCDIDVIRASRMIRLQGSTRGKRECTREREGVRVELCACTQAVAVFYFIFACTR
jgi:hypothetical protein